MSEMVERVGAFVMCWGAASFFASTVLHYLGVDSLSVAAVFGAIVAAALSTPSPLS